MTESEARYYDVLLAGKWVQALESGLGQRVLGATQGGSEGPWLCKPGNTHFPHSGATLPAFKIRLYTCLVWRPWAKQPKPLLPQVQTEVILLPT